MKLGYTEEAIQKLCRDTKEHRVLGTLYGFSIEEADNQSTMASDILRSREHKNKKNKKKKKKNKKKNKKKKKEKKENTKENIKRKYNTIKKSEGSTTHSSESSSAT